MITDTHTHLYSEQFAADIDALLAKALAKNIRRFFLPNIDLDSIAGMFALAERYPAHIFPMMGLHPTSVDAHGEETLALIMEQARGKKYYAIGEIGMDLFWDKTFQQEQERVFVRQVEWANREQLPIVIHSRDSIDLICDILEKQGNANCGGIFHCFTGTEIQARRILDLGYSLGIGGVVTYKNSHLPSVLPAIPLDKIVLETDAPYLPPVPHRGKRNEPEFILHTLEKLAELYKISAAELAEITTENAKKIFGI